MRARGCRTEDGGRESVGGTYHNPIRLPVLLL